MAKFIPLHPGRKQHDDVLFMTASEVFELPAENVAELIVRFANEGDSVAKEWLARLVAGPASKEFLADVVKRSGGVWSKTRPVAVAGRIQWETKYDDGGELGEQWLPSLLGGKREPPGHHALAIARILEAGIAHRVVWCRKADCRKFAFRARASEWCSDTCGSTARSRKKRG